MGGSSVVLYSGGLDSTVCLAEAVRDSDSVTALTFCYNQSNIDEVSKAEILCRQWEVPHVVVNLSSIGLGNNASVEIPARNSIFLSIALKVALETKSSRIYFGAEPDATYVDSSPAFIDKMRDLLNLFDVDLVTPVKYLRSKTEVLQRAFDLGVPIDLVHSCRFSPICGKCKTCGLMRKAFEELFGVDRGYKIYDLLLSGHLYGRSSTDLRPVNAPNFKAISALMSAATFTPTTQPLDVFTTGNWGAALTWAFDALNVKQAVNIVKTKDLMTLRTNVLNTNTKVGVWGQKQVLGHLPRGNKGLSYRCEVVQGNLRAALTGLGLTFDAVNGVELTT